MLFGPIGADARHGGYQYRNSDGTVAFSPDGSRLATVKGNAVLLWDLSGIPTGTGIKVAQARLPWKNGEPDCNQQSRNREQRKSGSKSPESQTGRLLS